MAECLGYFTRLSDRVLKCYDPLKVFYYNYWLYVCSGFWKYESDTQWRTNLYKCYQNSLIVLYVVSMTLFLVDAFLVRNDFDKLSFNMSSSVLLFMKVIQIVLLSRLRDNVVDIHDKLDHHLYVDTIGKSEDDKNIFRKRAENSLRITITFYGLLVVGLPLRIMADTALDSKAYLIPMPFREKFDPYYSYLYTQQVLAVFHFMATNLAFDLLEFTLILRFIAHYEVLEKNILKIKTLYSRTEFEKYVRGYVEVGEPIQKTRQILIREAKPSEEWRGGWNNHNQPRISLVKWGDKNKNGEEKVLQLLKQNIHHHQKLLIEIKNFSEIYSRPLLVQLCGLLIISGILTLQLIFLSDELSSPLFMQQILYAVTILLHIIYLSSFGSELRSKSTSTADALYDTPWYDMSMKNRKTVCLILQRLTQGTKLKGGRMITIDRPMCVKFFQFSYNMVALLKKKI